MRKGFALLGAGVALIFLVTPAFAIPLNVYSVNGPQDPLTIEGPVHELGEPPTVFPPDELIQTIWHYTCTTACTDPSGPQDDPAISNVLVTMTNLTNIAWHDVHYVADEGTTITNFDGFIGNAGRGDAMPAFRIDWLGINRPLLLESIAFNNIFEPGETWQFIIQDFVNAAGGPPTPFDSIGIAGLSPGWPPSTGSIIAIPEPAMLSLLALGGLVVMRRKRK